MSKLTNNQLDSEQAQARRTRPHRTTFAQNFTLTWLDSGIDESQDDFKRSLEKLQRIVTHIDTITDTDPKKFLQFLKQNASVQIFLIISGFLGQNIISYIHDQSNLDTIFVFCTNHEKHRQWARKWPKIAGVFTDIDELCHSLKHHAQLCDRNASSFTVTKADLQHLPPSFMYTQLLKEILIEMDFDDKAMNELVLFCRDMYRESPSDLAMIDEFQRHYGNHSPIWWYTREGFTYSLLNRALRTQDMEVLIKMGFFLRDLHRRIEKLHAEQQHSNNKFVVYRGQGMHTDEFKNIQCSEGGLLAFNSFLSTSRNRAVSMGFARQSLDKPSHVGVLFTMTIDPTISGTPFASLDGESFFEESEAEVLFSMHTVFRLGKTMLIEDGIWQVNLILMNDEEDKALKKLTESMRRSTSGSTGWHQLARLLLRTGEYTKAQAIYEVLLDEIVVVDDEERSHLYHQLGYIADSLGCHKEALEYHHKSLQIALKSLPENHPDLAISYNNIGGVHSHMGEYSKALEYYHKSLEIRLKAFPDNHPHLATSYSNIGSVHDRMGEYSKALEYHHKSLQIYLKSLPDNHPHLATSYNNIGGVHSNMEDYSKALEYYHKSLEIRLKALPDNHPHLGTSYACIGSVHDSMGEYSKALEYYRKSLEIRLKSLPDNHPHLAASYACIGSVHDSIGEYSKALEYHQKSLEIKLKALPDNHPDLAISYSNIGSVHDRMGEYSKALEYYHKSLEIRLKALPDNDPDLAISYSNIGAALDSNGRYEEALEYHKKSIELSQTSTPSGHTDFAIMYRKMGTVLCHCKQYNQAVDLYKKAIEIYEASPNINKVGLAHVYSRMGEAQDCMGNHREALEFCSKARLIEEAHLPEKHPVTAFTINTLGLAERHLGNLKKSLDHHEKALKIRTITLPASHPDTAWTHSGIAAVYDKMGDREKACESIEKAICIAEKSLPSDHPHLEVYRQTFLEFKKA